MYALFIYKFCPLYRYHIITFKTTLDLGGFFVLLTMYIYIPCVREHHFSAPLMSLHIQNTPKNHPFMRNKIIEYDVCGHRCLVFQVLCSYIATNPR